MRKILSFFAILLLVPFATQAEGNNCSPSTNGEVVCLDNPLEGDVVDVRTFIGIVIKGILTIIGSITLFMMVWGGFQWLTSAGNADKVESGKKTMIWAVIGVVLVFTSYIIVNTITNFLSTGNG